MPWEDLSGVMRKHSKGIPWDQRLSQLFGRATKLGPAREILLQNQAELGKSASWQVRIVDWKQHPAEWVSLLKHCNYKFLLHTGGASYSGRLKFLTMCGSAIIFPQDPWQEFWYPLLQNGSNIYFTEAITPENKGLPILDALEHLQSNESLAAHIGKGAETVAYEALTKRNILLYIAELLHQYSQLMGFLVSVHPAAVTLEESLMGQTIFKKRRCGLFSRAAACYF